MRHSTGTTTETGSALGRRDFFRTGALALGGLSFADVFSL